MFFSNCFFNDDSKVPNTTNIESTRRSGTIEITTDEGHSATSITVDRTTPVASIDER